jgi:hypothetical protein
VWSARWLKRYRAPTVSEQLVAQQWQMIDLLGRRTYEEAFDSQRFREPKRLLASGFKVHFQHDEDGIIEEIFRRIGVTDRYFVEFGVGDGLENRFAAPFTAENHYEPTRYFVRMFNDHATGFGPILSAEESSG